MNSADSIQDASMSAQAYRTIVDLIYQHSRIRLGDDKQTLLANRLRKRLLQLNMTSYEEYCSLLETPGAHDEIEHLVDLISTNHTRFYREPDHFSFLTFSILPPLIPRLLEGGSPLRIWSAASSSGEEPYTLAIILSEYLRDHPAVTWKIEATDISRRIVAKAERAIYRMDAVEPVPPELLKRYFQKGVGDYEGHCRVRPELKEKVRFERVNLFQPEYPVAFNQHVIFCRNVMIYFDLQSREVAVNRLSRHLAPGGYLIVGHSESLMGVNHDLVSVKQGVYQKP
ncbi:MAG: protein-glutamate O-methyltransferase [Verrucomicrobia bacterium]|nr:protein-glutamate O-methyltransferase [Verrucomicrobiota bacterium]